MDLDFLDSGGARIVRCRGDRLDAMVAIRFKENFRGLMEDGIGHFVLDLSEVEFLDSSGLGAVVAVFKLVGPEKRFDLAGLQPAVARVFQLTRMDSVFAIFDDAAAAAAAPRAQAVRA
jgi:anti-sigma B factor antagonist